MLERIGVVRELTGKKRNRLFGYDQYLAILGEGPNYRKQTRVAFELEKSLAERRCVTWPNH